MKLKDKIIRLSRIKYCVLYFEGSIKTPFRYIYGFGIFLLLGYIALSMILVLLGYLFIFLMEKDLMVITFSDIKHAIFRDFTNFIYMMLFLCGSVQLPIIFLRKKIEEAIKQAEMQLSEAEKVADNWK